MCWPWWTHSQHSYLLTVRRRNQNFIHENVSFIDGLERGLSAGRLTRREYKVRVLEASYPPAFKGDFAESKEYIERGDENVCCEPPRLIFGNQSSEARVGEGKAGVFEAKKGEQCDRRVVDDSLCRRVFQSLGSDLIAPWLTPVELSRVEIAADCAWDWGQAWHYGKVKNRQLASRVEFLLPGLDIEYMLELCNKDELFSILWYLMPVEDFIRLVKKHEHFPSLRKLSYLSS